MLESVIKLPRCNDAHKIHAWLSDRFGSHRTHLASKARVSASDADVVKYVFTARASGEDSILTVFHSDPIPKLAGSSSVKIPEPGSTLRFRARLNPTKKSCHAGRRIPVSEADLFNWFQRQMNDGEMQRQADPRAEVINDAAEILSLDVVYSGFERLSHGSAARGKFVVDLWSVEVEGVLRVVDSNILRSRLLEGVGRYKGHGYGMVAPEGSVAYRVMGFNLYAPEDSPAMGFNL